MTWRLAEILTTQGELAAQVSETLRPRHGESQRLLQVRRQPESAEAYLLYLRGRAAALDNWTADGFRKGIDYLSRATRLDPTYALAFAGLASTYYDASGVWLRPEEAMPLAKNAATHALELDGELAEAHVALGQVLAEYEWRWPEAEQHYRRALQLNQNLTQAHVYFGFWLAHQGRLPAAIEELQLARRLDPLTTFPAMALAHYLYVARRTDEAIAVCRKAITADPDFYMTHSVLGTAYEQKGLLPEALAEFEEARRLDPGQPFTLGYLGHALATAGRRDEAARMAEALEHYQGNGYVDPFAVAIVHAGLGERDRAFTWLEAAFRIRSESLLHYKDAPLLDDLRSDPRFTDLVRRMGLAKAGAGSPHG